MGVLLNPDFNEAHSFFVSVFVFGIMGHRNHIDFTVSAIEYSLSLSKRKFKVLYFSNDTHGKVDDSSCSSLLYARNFLTVVVDFSRLLLFLDLPAAPRFHDLD